MEIHPFRVLFKDAWSSYMSRFPVYVGIVLPPVILGFLGGLSLATEPRPLGYALLTGGFLFSVLAYLALVYSIQRELSFKDAYVAALHNFPSYAWLTILSTFIVWGGFLLGILPGAVFAIWFAFATYIFVEEGQRGFGPLMKSREYLRGHFAPFVGRMSILALIILAFDLAVLAPTYLYFGERDAQFVNMFLQVVTTPLSVIFGYTVYKNIRFVKPHLAHQAAVYKKGVWTGIAILGLAFPFTVAYLLPFWK